MCLIIYCGKNTDKKSDFLLEAIRVASDFNPDGMGYAIKKASDNSIYLDRGYFNVDNFIKAIDEHAPSNDDELLLHLRIGNKGAVDKTMSHPFLVSDDANKIVYTDEMHVDGPVVAHNGTMHKHSVANSKFSDTYYFIKNVLSKESVLNFLKADPTTFDEVMQPHLNLSRLALMFPNEEASILIGKWYQEEGYYFSKDYYYEYFPSPQKDSWFKNLWNNNSNLTDEEYYKQRYGFDDWNDNYDDDFDYGYTESNKSLAKYTKPEVEVPVLTLKNPRPYFKDSLGVKHQLYLGLYIPTEETLKKFTPNITEDNWWAFDIKCLYTNMHLGVVKNKSYIISHVDKAGIVHIINMDDYEDTIELTTNEFLNYFSLNIKDEETLEFYSKYYDLVKAINCSKNAYKRFKKDFHKAKEKERMLFTHKGITNITHEIAEELLINLEKELKFERVPDDLPF